MTALELNRLMLNENIKAMIMTSSLSNCSVLGSLARKFLPDAGYSLAEWVSCRTTFSLQRPTMHEAKFSVCMDMGSASSAQSYATGKYAMRWKRHGHAGNVRYVEADLKKMLESTSKVSKRTQRTVPAYRIGLSVVNE